MNFGFYYSNRNSFCQKFREINPNAFIILLINKCFDEIFFTPLHKMKLLFIKGPLNNFVKNCQINIKPTIKRVFFQIFDPSNHHHPYLPTSFIGFTNTTSKNNAILKRTRKSSSTRRKRNLQS